MTVCNICHFEFSFRHLSSVCFLEDWEIPPLLPFLSTLEDMFALNTIKVWVTLPEEERVFKNII